MVDNWLRADRDVYPPFQEGCTNCEMSPCGLGLVKEGRKVQTCCRSQIIGKRDFPAYSGTAENNREYLLLVLLMRHEYGISD